MGDPVCWMHLLDEDGRMPDPVDEEEEEEPKPEAPRAPKAPRRLS